MNEFIHLHTHSDYSLLDGACSISQLVTQAYKFNMPALALTDHGNLFGAIEFYRKAKKRGIKPIIGCEVYIAPQSRFKKRKEKREETSFHLILLSKNKEGYQNLIELVTAGFLEGFYYKPRIDKEILSQKKEGLIALSGCLKGEIPSLLKVRKFEEAKKVASFYQNLFKDDFYLELQNEGLDIQKEINGALIKLSQNLSIPVVATNDVHYLHEEDAPAHDALLCIQTGKTIEDKNRLRFSSSKFYFTSPEEMGKLFSHIPEALSNTNKIADKCNLELSIGKKIYLPSYKVPTGYDLDSYLRKLCEEGLSKRYSQDSKEIRERLDKELIVISQMNYSGYFLIVWDLIRHAKEKGILVGPGRGSVAGSLVAYLLGITNVDPLAYGLLFERFLNSERTAMPDIDIDIQDSRREEVIAYVKKKYGKENVAQIITFGTMAARAVVRDVGRVLNIPYGKVDRIAKLIPFNTKLKIAVEENEELRILINNDEKIKTLFKIAQKLEGLTRHASTHAAGIVIAPDKLTLYTPLYRTNRNEITTQYEMHSLEAIGLLKMDFLGLKTLNVIQGILQMIEKEEKKKINLEKIPFDDKKTYELLCRGDTLGVFQVESQGMQDLVKKLHPEKFEEIIALLALYRPGPLHSRMMDDFINRKHGKDKIEYLHPKLKPILEETYGVILYQEQVMRIANSLAGFTLGEADILRRAMGKKNPQLMDEQKEKFIQGAKKRGISSLIAKKIFELMAYFAGYGFNKSHSAGYAIICYQTAYLKAHYPLEFMAALLTSERENTDKLVLYFNECKRMGIEVLPPDINRSSSFFATTEDNKIRFGLSAIKNVGEIAISSILKEREKEGNFTSIFDFCRRIDSRVVNKRVIESLIKCGAFDSLPEHRSQNLAVIDQAIEQASQIQQDREKGQLSFLETLKTKENNLLEEKFPKIEKTPELKKLSWEKDLLGIYMSGHPLQKFSSIITHWAIDSIKKIKETKKNGKIKIVGMINSLNFQKDKRGKTMAFLSLEDLESEIEIIVFSSLYEKCSENLEKDKLVIVKGKIDITNHSSKVIADEIIPFSKLKELNYYLNIKIKEDYWEEETLKKLKEVLSSHQGNYSLCLHLFSSQREKAVIKSKTLRMNFSDSLISQIEEVLGKESIWLSETV